MTSAGPFWPHRRIETSLPALDRIDRAVLRRELERDPPTYLYVLLSTLSVFASFS
jgi:hypothetical protein